MFQQTAGPIPCVMCRQLVVKFCRNIFANKVLATIQEKGLVCNDEFDLVTAKDHLKHSLQMDCVGEQISEFNKTQNAFPS